MASEYRPLRPAPPPATRGRYDLDHSTRTRKTRHKLINAACDACRKRKTKVTECAFETKDTEQTRSQATKLRMDQLAADLNDATRILNHLRLASDGQVAHVLARLRANEPFALIAASTDPGCDTAASSRTCHAAEQHSLEIIPSSSDTYPRASGCNT
ncbi:hypothetical protein SLS58_010637 [Diplodia intermedia]|uniref:Zn(2)-C6 fungal-type domain-containing protein n=1 Tax=Diplodia intermedia TaxID=856260 RepID=A0ABR3T4N1_9PEZI